MFTMQIEGFELSFHTEAMTRLKRKKEMINFLKILNTTYKQIPSYWIN